MRKARLIVMGVAAAFASAAACGGARAAIKTQTVDYAIDGKPFEGYLAYDDARKGKMPGVLVFPFNAGIGDNERERAQQLAKMGYVAFVADIYGKGIQPKGQDAMKAMMPYVQDRALYRQHAKAGLDMLLKEPMVDTKRIAAIGFCFGGMGALELARSGAPLKAVVVFHSLLTSPTPADANNIKEPVVALQGADDPIVPAAQREQFAKEMDDAHVNWQLVLYGNTVHCFTDAHAGSDPSHGCAYNPVAANEAWLAMSDTLHATLR